MVTGLRFSTLAIVGLAAVAVACGGRVRERLEGAASDRPSTGGTADNTDDSSGGTGGRVGTSGSADDVGDSRGSGGAVVTPGAGDTFEGAGGSTESGRGGSAGAAAAGAPAITPNGGTNGDTAVGGGGAGGAASDSSCSTAWGTPSDSGYRGMRGTLNGQAFSVDGKDIGAGIGFCFSDGPGKTPGSVGGLIPLPGMTLSISDCRAEITSPSDTTWHDLDIELSAQVTMPVMGTNSVAGGNSMTWTGSVASGHVHLEGPGPEGPVTIDADFYLDEEVIDTCAPPPPKIG